MSNTYFELKSLLFKQGGLGPRWSGYNEHDRYGAGEERYGFYAQGVKEG